MTIWFAVSAKYTDVSRDTIYPACERRELHHARIGGRRSIQLKAEWFGASLERPARGAVVAREDARGGSYHGTDCAHA